MVEGTGMVEGSKRQMGAGQRARGDMSSSPSTSLFRIFATTIDIDLQMRNSIINSLSEISCNTNLPKSKISKSN